ncbi:hypothetical protein P7D22_22910 [Lichenihabitans sp. Uapishka_5]|uniref:hypothetical protein n=1 Tax=Lichenihabitans sp. Uapishka_5 TaxID=3037302 RepID=UPI0029E81514|nr:hypothetical protein [Lichenihabitans sp. Uapishka_5]MDX7954000.1 hypothetical protein [Lichenihabitans sp. Uapishka_5]
MSDQTSTSEVDRNSEIADLPLDFHFIEQAEYIPESIFLALDTVHPEEESIVRRLAAGGAKLLVGPRGCGKTTLMLKAYYQLLHAEDTTTLPVYVNFKLSLKLEPLYQNTANAAYWFRLWLLLKIFDGIHSAIELSNRYLPTPNLPSRKEISSAVTSIESGRLETVKNIERFSLEQFAAAISNILEENDLARCVLLLDDAAHAFSPRQQEDFFEFFRQVKSREISPKAAIYPGITTHSPTFHVGHDAEQIDVWIKPGRGVYVEFMRSLALKRFGGTLPRTLSTTPDALEFLAFASFGVPRSFLNMLRTIYHEEAKLSNRSTLDRRRLIEISKQSREAAHNVYDSLSFKLPAYKEYVAAGRLLYQSLLAGLKDFNQARGEDNQALEVGLKRPISTDIEKVIGFFQYAGLLMPAGENSRGVKGSFEIYLVHFGDLINDNVVVGRRTKSISLFVKAFTSQTHQVWPRMSSDGLIPSNQRSDAFRLSLPHCQNCGAERVSENAKFCHSCGSQLKTASLYDELTRQDIAILPLSKTMLSRIKTHSKLRTVKDILMDSDRVKLRSIPFIGPVRATRIAMYAEEHVA